MIRYISPSCLEIIGWQPAEMIAKDLRQFILPDDMPVLEDLEAVTPPDRTAYTHGRIRFLKKIRPPSGSASTPSLSTTLRVAMTS